ncbi:MAG: hypothetical protein GC139_05920 [Sideroxydans sp.]|nr:hypothetical protein [Sideroxydans sp.]
MNQFRAFLLACLVPSFVVAEPLLTISCDTPKGSRMAYGVSIPERVEAEINKKPVPKAHLKGPIADGYLARPTFVVDSAKKKLTVVWSESASDLEQKKKSKELGVPYCCSPPPATSAEIIMFTPEQISALQVTAPYTATVYSFFPKLGTAFITTQGTDLGMNNSEQMSLFSTCEFSWNRPR